MNHSKNIFDKLKNDKTDTILVVIEVPNGSDIKYEVDHNSGLLFVDRKLFTSMRYPCNYGFIPNTLEGDGDPVDVLVLGDFTLTPFSILKAKPIGVLLTQDEKGKDSKIIAIPDKKIDQSYSLITDIDQVPLHIKDKIKHFFEHYKELEEGKYVKVLGWSDKSEAQKIIQNAMENYNRQ